MFPSLQSQISIVLVTFIVVLLGSTTVAEQPRGAPLTAQQWVSEVVDAARRVPVMVPTGPQLPWLEHGFEGIRGNGRQRQAVKGHEQRKSRKAIQDEIREYVNGVTACYGSIGLTLSVVYRSEVVFAEGFGVRDLTTQLPVTQDTTFSIGSTTKAFTGILAAMMVGEDKLAWDKPVRGYLPDFRLHNDFADMRANTRDLLAHRVGLPRNDLLFLSNPDETRETMISRLRYLPNDRDFRDEFEYNNWMVFVAGYLAAKLNGGQSWEEMVSERLFRPLNMTRTTTGIYEALPLGNLASCYAATSQGPQAYPEDVNKILNLLGPSGSIHSTAIDMAKWIKFQLSGGRTEGGEQLVKPLPFQECRLRQFANSRRTNSVTETVFPASYFSTDWGFGWLSGTYRGRATTAHTGSTIGHTSLVYLVPDEGLGIFMSGNNPATDIKVEQLVAAFVTDLLLELDPWLDVPSSCDFPCSFVDCNQGKGSHRRPETPLDFLIRLQHLREHIPSQTTGREALEEYAGTYFDPGYDTMTLSLTGNHTLYFVFNDIRGPMILVPGQQEDLLFALPEYFYNLMVPVIPAQFQRNTEGKIVSVVVTLEPLVPTTFVRI